MNIVTYDLPQDASFKPYTSKFLSLSENSVFRLQQKKTHNITSCRPLSINRLSYYTDTLQITCTKTSVRNTAIGRQSQMKQNTFYDVKERVCRHCEIQKSVEFVFLDVG